MNHTRREFLNMAGGVTAAAALCTTSTLGVSASNQRRPNIVIIFTDDQGYGDLGCYGHPSIRTPHLDQMAAEGLRFTDFYAAATLCTPSRAALLTGRYAIRSGMNQVLFPHSEGGLPQSEIMLAEALKNQGYATGLVGKWHLGIHEGSRPHERGFDYTYGLPYSNDMDPMPETDPEDRYLPNPPKDGWNVPLIRDGDVIERPADQTTLTKRYTEKSLKFIRGHRDEPFFLYLAHTMPHTPVFASESFEDQSLRGRYGDAIEEIDRSVGQILETLQAEGLADDTLVFFTSDNGPWLTEQEQGGSAGLLRGGKGTTWEGGMRVPGIAWMPGRIHPGVTSQPASTLDIFPTVMALIEASAPEGVHLDGIDIGPLLFSREPLPARPFYYYRGDEVFACRLGDWKAHLITQGGWGIPGDRQSHEPPVLYHMLRDPSERFDRAEENPDVIEQILAAIEAHNENIEPMQPQR